MFCVVFKAWKYQTLFNVWWKRTTNTFFRVSPSNKVSQTNLVICKNNDTFRFCDRYLWIGWQKVTLLTHLSYVYCKFKFKFKFLTVNIWQPQLLDFFIYLFFLQCFPLRYVFLLKINKSIWDVQTLLHGCSHLARHWYQELWDKHNEVNLSYSDFLKTTASQTPALKHIKVQIQFATF